MSKHQLTHYVVQTNYGTYWAGMNQFTDQIRKAQMYTSVKLAESNVRHAIERHNKNTQYPITSFKVLAVEVVVKNVVNEYTVQKGVKK